MSLRGESEERLIERATRGDQSAVNELLGRYRSKAMDAAMGMCGNADEADDLVQDAYLKAWQSIGTLGLPYSFWPWLRMIMANTWSDKTRAVESGPWLRHYYDPNPYKPQSNTETLIVLAEDEEDQPVSRQLATARRLSGSRVMHSLDGMFEAGLDIACEDLDPARIYERKEDWKNGLARVDDLPEKQRQVCELALKGYTYTEIAEKVGISNGSVRYHMHAARQKLKEL